MKASEDGKDIKFYADSMLGSLARWMRTLGYDVGYSSSIEDPELVKRAVDENRIILTRDTLIVKRRKARGRSFFISSDRVGEQLRQVTGEYGVPEGLSLTRCLRCNTVLNDIGKGSVEGKVPPYVFRTQDKFSVCFTCGRIYWGGTHRERMLEDLKKLLKG